MHHKNDKGERLYFFFLIRMWQNEPINMEPDKCSEIGWHPVSQLPTDMIEHVRIALTDIQEGKTYVEFGF
jgi:hypothetical protein